MSIYEIIDVTEWEKGISYLKGSKDKEELIDPTSKKQVMFKEPALNPDGLTKESGDNWSEKLSSEVAKAAGINVHDVELGKLGEQYGVIIYFSLEVGKEILHEGLEYISIDGFDPEKRGGYSFQLIEEILKNENDEFLAGFIDILVFDALIGNTDRHCENWGIIEAEDGGKRLAPAYDNSSSLAREYHSNEKKTEILLKIKDAFEGYNRRSKSMIGWENKIKISHFKFIELLLNKYPQLTKESIEKIETISNEKIDRIVDKIPEEIMKDNNKELTKRILKHRKNEIVEIKNRSEK